MKIDIVALFPGMFENVFGESIIKRARERKLVDIKIHNLRDWTHDRHRTADDKPFGGGPGMVIKPEPVYEAADQLLSLRGAVRRRSNLNKQTKVILLSPQGRKLDQKLVKKLAKYKRLILICGHYEGVDERVRKLAHEEISIGDYILTCGEIPAMALVDAITRLIPGALGDANSKLSESFEDNLLEYPQYTRPAEYRGMKVPKVLLSGNHKQIAEWRKNEATKKTKRRRPDLLKKKKRSILCQKK